MRVAKKGKLGEIGTAHRPLTELEVELAQVKRERSERPKREKERSAWWWSTARVFLWDAIPTLLRQQRSGLPRRHSSKSKSPKGGRKATD
ncbi:MAG: hypothetical protein HY912_02425 [Desulfomonile tiedjei]|uniref:Uncharacterized protein n=1 Tax=Desulfomonile tiedjei TaxID=2358 RepID=A0A9D6Z4L5_9BACT|nr:hypothetical protein [Desulfomonile tiedjei]